MQISSLFAGYPVVCFTGEPGGEVTNITYDSRKVRSGSLFVCIDGFVQDGHEFIDQAVQRGAVAIVVQKAVQLPPGSRCALIQVGDSRQALAYVASRFFGQPSRKLKVIAATGSAGKLSVTYLIYNLLRRKGEACGLINGMETLISDQVIYQSRNHPGAPEIQEALDLMQQDAQRFAVMPVSRQDILLERVRYVSYEVGILLNSKNAFSDKEIEFYRSCRHLVMNMDDVAFPLLQSRLSGCSLLTFGFHRDADIRATHVHITGRNGVIGTGFEVRSRLFKSFKLFLPEPGRFNVYNLLAVIATAFLLGFQPGELRDDLEQLESPGRTQRVPNRLNLQIYIDSAWQPAELEYLLTSLRPYCSRRMILVCGAAGNRNQSNRFALGRLCGELADYTFLTVASSRTESAADIVKDMEAGLLQTAAPYEAVPDRKTAIRKAIQMAEPGDFVLLVGKGETRYEMSSEQTAPLSDMDMAGETLAALQNQQKEKDDGRIMGSLEDFRAACAGVFLQGETAGQTPVVGVSTDTRTVCAGELFVALSGERFDAHDYLQTAEGRGACAVVVDNEEKWRAAALHLPTILVANTLAAYEAIAAWYRKRLAAQVIGVTGSVGKTGTRDMIAAALEPSFRVVRTAGNLNNEIGLSATLLGVAEEAEVVVAEMGIGGPGEMERLADIAKPDIAILTMIGYSHIEHLKRLEETRIEKSKIADALPAGGWLLLNLDDPLLCRTATERRGTGIRIGGISIRDRATEAASERPPIDLLLEADELERTPNGTSFRVRYHTGEAPAGQREIRVVLEVNGQHHVRNALFGLLCAELLGAEAEQAAEGLRNYQPTGNRQNISVHDGVTVINDTYNASAESMFAGFEVMQDLAEQNAGARMVCVLGSINELGSYAEAIHTDIGRKLAGYKPSIVYTCGAYGEVLAAVCASELYGKYNADIRFFENRDQLISTLLDQLRRGDIVFVKGSRSYKMEDVCTAIEQNRGGTNHG